jgi:tRNA A-37 threonylcarbamoyl transferase component Bud32
MTAPHANHPTAADLAAFAVGKLNDADARAVAEHLAGCPDCRRAAEDASGDSFVARLRAAGTPNASDNTAVPGGRGPAAPPDVPPELANHPRYRILKELGRGGMGVVYLAQQTAMNRQVVIKVVNKALLDHPDAVERFRREVHAAARLSHPNIVTAHDAEQAGELHMLVMEFVPGQSLADVLKKRGLLAVAHACHFARQAALGLQHAYEQGMVHRDIKPHNLMVTPKGQVKILDFGLAKIASEQSAGKGLTSTGAYMGTPDYCAPEQATDARTADVRADLYSLGCTLYALLAGRPPFEEDTAVKTILAHLERAPAPLPTLRPDVPEALWRVVARLLAKDPAQRYQKPAEVAQALAPFVKPGLQGAAPAAGGAASPGQGTKAAGDTRRPSPASQVTVPPTAARAKPTSRPQAAPFEELDEPAPRPKRKARPGPGGRWRKRWPLLAAGAALLGLVVLGAVMLRLRTQYGTVLLENLPSDAEVSLDGRKIEITVPGRAEPVRVEVPEGRHRLKVTSGATEIAGEQVTVSWGKADPLKITLRPNGGGGRPAAAPAPQLAAGKVRAYRHGYGKWRVEGDELIQEEANTPGTRVLFGDSSWVDYDLAFEVQRIEPGIVLCNVNFRVESLLDFWAFGIGDTFRILTVTVDGTGKRIQTKGWTVDGAWHKVGVKVRGERLHCFMDGETTFEDSDDRHPRGGVALVVASPTRFRNLKVTDASGRVLVDGARSLELAPEQGDPGPGDPAPAGTVWKGKWRQNVDGKFLPEEDAVLKVQKRAGARFEGEYWVQNEAMGLKVDGNIDGYGNISWKPTAILAGAAWPPNILGSHFQGAVKGKQLRAFGWPAAAEVTLSWND